MGSYAAGSPWIGVLAALLGGGALAMLYAVSAIRFRADQVVIGIAINLLAIGLTRFLLRLFFDSSSNSPRVPGFEVKGSGAGFVALATNPFVWVGLGRDPGRRVDPVPHAVRLARARCRRASAAAASVGVPVARVRYLAVLLSGMVAGLGGAYLALDQHQFTDGMTAGRGFIALAATIFGRWNPTVAPALACLLFAAAETLQIQLQGTHAIPSQFVEMIPYLLTIIALAGLVGRAVPPAALGRTSTE